MTTPRSPIRASRPSTLPERLERDFARLAGSPSVRARLVRSPLAGHTDLHALLVACGGDRSADPDTADLVLADLVREATGGDALAARVVLQRLLPGLIAIAARRSRQPGGDLAALLDELASTAWEVVATFPIDRRPARVAGNLCRDIEYRCCSAPQRRREARVRVVLEAAGDPPVGPRGVTDLHPAHELEDLLVELGAGRWASSERSLLVQLLSGDRLEDVAARLGCTERTVRNRRDRLVAELRAQVGTAA